MKTTMKNNLKQGIRSLSFIAATICASVATASAEPVIVHHVQGTVHGFLEMRSEDGHVLASGDAVQVVRGDQITSRTTFHFKDGSIDDETTIFSQRRNFKLISDHHVQKGPFFPHPMDMLIDATKSQVTSRTTGKDGKDDVKTEHVDLPLDLANGMVPVILGNIGNSAQPTTVSMVVATPKPRVAKLVISHTGEDPFSIGGSSQKAVHFEIKIQLGGVPGMVAPLIGKAPPNIQVWLVGGEAPTFLREKGPISADSPIMTIALVSPTWSDSAEQGK
jgi:hypothetical protein